MGKIQRTGPSAREGARIQQKEYKTRFSYTLGNLRDGLFARTHHAAYICAHAVRMQRANRRSKSSRADVTAISHVLQGLITTATKSTNYFTHLYNHFNKSTSCEFCLLHKVFKIQLLRSVAKLAYPSHSNSYSARTKQPRFPVGAAK